MNDISFFDPFDDLDDAALDQLDLDHVISSATQNPPQPSPPPPPKPPYSAALSDFDPFSPPPELSQKTTSFDSRPPRPAATPASSTSLPTLRRPDSDKDLEIERLKKELGRSSKQLANLEKQCHELKEEKDKRDNQLKCISCKNEEEKAHNNCSNTINKGTGIIGSDYHKISTFQNGASSKYPTVEKTFKSKGVETDMVCHQEAQSCQNDDLPAYLDLSGKLLAIWGSPTSKRLGNNVISKLLTCCQRDFHILFGFMSMSPPSEMTRKLLTDISSSGRAIDHLKDCFCTTEAAKVSNLYLALTKINDGTIMLETMIEPLLDLCGLENVVIVQSSLCILHTLLKFLLEFRNNFGRRDNVFIEQLSIGKEPVGSGGSESVKDEMLVNKEKLSREGDWNYLNSLQTHVNWVSLFEIMHQIAMKRTKESVRVEAVSIMNFVLLRSNAYFERAQFDQKIIFKTISELLKKDAGLNVKSNALRLLHLVLSCPNLLAAFCCGCTKGGTSSAVDSNTSSDFENFEIMILQGLADCVAFHGSGLLELKVSRNAILVLAFLASSGKPGFEIFIGHKLSRGVNYLMLILQLLVSEVDLEAGAHTEQPEVFEERTFLMREILILLNRLVSNPLYSAAVLCCLAQTRDMAGLTVDVAIRLSRKIETSEQQNSVVHHIREMEIVDLARVFKKRVFTYLGDDLL